MFTSSKRTTSSSGSSFDRNSSGSGHEGLVEKGSNSPSSSPAGVLRRKRNVVLLVSVVLVIGMALGLGLGLGLRHKRRSRMAPTRTSARRSSSLPTDNQNNTLSSLTSPGEWYTTSQPNDKSVFDFSKKSLTFGNWTNSTDGVDLVVDTSVVHQPIYGFGAALTDSSAYLLKRMKDNDRDTYTRTMDSIFNPRTGVPIIRVPLGSSDFSLEEYTFLPSPLAMVGRLHAQVAAGQDEKILSQIDLGDAKKYILPVLKDAVKIRPDLRILFTPWSPPAFMKDNSDISGGSLIKGYEPILAEYYLRSLMEFQAEGVSPWGMTIQNEPSWAAPYPSCQMSTTTQAKIAQALSASIKNSTNQTFAALQHLTLLGHDNNFEFVSDAIALSKQAGDVLDGYAFHCYKGDPSQLGGLVQALTKQSQGGKGMYMSECSGTATRGFDRWSSQIRWLENLLLPSLRLDFRAALSWNLALDPSYGPRLESAICDNCVGPLTISNSSKSHPAQVRAGPQYINMNHLNAASQDLSRIGGGISHRVGSWWTDAGDRKMNGSHVDCLDAIAFAAPLVGGDLPLPSVRGKGKVNKRMGMVLVNQCGVDVGLNIAVDGMPTKYISQPGLTTLVWLGR
ncbi:hypothetical protein A4X13_0g6693 [Tilletia indica]|uniref:Glycosyl hydrolase family 30 TIM-barrel domain-containing protein n=1 Tax=Tilletia indica TaxID=43049 RepID=A0A177TWF4_9BASI|nr:hypothetical protein A4X13_0g6693 [Tilletia indica]